MQSRKILYFWVIAIIFPFAWFVKTVAPGNEAFRFAFRMEWTHILAHFILYTGLAVLCELAFANQPSPRSLGRSALRLLILVLVVAAIQEGLQHMTRSTEPGILPSLFDLGVDLAGSALGFGIITRIRLKSWNFLKVAFVKG